MLSQLFEGSYTLKRNTPSQCDPWDCWTCTVVFDGLIVTAPAKSRRGAFKKGHKAMIEAVKLRNAVSGLKGLCNCDDTE